MNRQLIIDGNAVYEIDEECMLRKRLKEQKPEVEKERKTGNSCRNKADHRP